MNTEIQTLESLSYRISQMERQNRKIKQAWAAILLVLLSIFVMGQVKTAKVTTPKAVKAIEAGRFILQDGSGKKRAELGLFADRPALVVYDREGNAALSLGEDADGSGLVVYDSNSEKAASIVYGFSGTVLTLYEEGKKRLNLSITSRGPAFGIVGRKGEAKAAMGLTDQGDPFLQLFGPAEHGGAQLLASPDRTALRFMDASERPRAVLGVLEKESAPGLVLNDGTGASRAVFMLTPEGPGLDFFDKNRTRIWSAQRAEKQN